MNCCLSTNLALEIMDMLSNIIGDIIGGVIGIFAALISIHETFKREKRRQESLAAAVLYNDLRSIEGYLKNERSPVNLRYSENWQQNVSYCSFFKADDVEFIYLIYDEVYNYNYHYKLKENNGEVRKDDICSYKNLKIQMFETSKELIDVNKHSVRYQKLIENLKNHME